MHSASTRRLPPLRQPRRPHRLPSRRLLPPKYNIAPALPRTLLPNTLIQHLHPALLILRAIRIEINDLTIRKADPESLFHEHVAFFLFREA